MTNGIEKAIDFASNKKYEDAFFEFDKISNKKVIFSSLKSKWSYLWSIYYAVIRQDFTVWNNDYEKIQKYIKIIYDNCDHSDLIFIITVFRVIDYLESFASVDYTKIEQWIDFLDVDKLSTDLSDPVEVAGKMIRFPSHKEKWFMIKTKCCEMLEKYHECLRVSRKALKELTIFNFNNDIWFKRREAISLANLGEYDKSITIFNEILKNKRDGFLYVDIGNIYYKKGDIINAKANILIGINKQKKIEFCIPALRILSNIFIVENKKEISDLLMKAIIVTKQNNGWSLKDDAEYKFEDHFLEQYPNDRDVINAYYLKIKELLREREKDPNKIYQSGYIKVMLENRKSGFIASDSGESMYFNIKDISQEITSDLLNRRVVFQQIDSFDKKKDKISKSAVDIWFEE